MTDEEAETMRKQIAAHEAEKAAAARQGENDRRTAAREKLEPVAAVLSTKLAALRDELEEAGRALPPEEWDLALLVRNVVVTADSAIARAQRRLDDTRPIPDEEPEPTPVAAT